MLMVYGKYKTDKEFKPMDMTKCCQVEHKVLATVYEDSQKSRLEKSLEKVMSATPDWKFELRKA